MIGGRRGKALWITGGDTELPLSGQVEAGASTSGPSTQSSVKEKKWNETRFKYTWKSDLYYGEVSILKIYFKKD